MPDDACVVCIVVVLAPLAAITIDLPFVLCDNNCFVYVAMILFIFYKKIERPMIVFEFSTKEFI
jgi:hypothetical protein